MDSDDGWLRLRAAQPVVDDRSGGEDRATQSRHQAKAVFVACLGVLIYLRDDAADAIFAWVASRPAGRQFVCTFSQPDASTEGPPAPGSAAARVAAAGEPWRTRSEPEAMLGRLRAAGFRSVDLLFAEDVTERYLRGRTDGLFQPSRVVIADASV